MTYDIEGRTYDVVTYDILEYRRYDVTYDVVATDHRDCHFREESLEL